MRNIANITFMYDSDILKNIYKLFIYHYSHQNGEAQPL